jgi:hypothetical protein
MSDHVSTTVDPITATPKVGDPVSIHYWTDTRAAVVTRVTAKTITVACVETEDAAPDMRCDAGAYGLRPTRAAGILDKIIYGTEQRYTFRANAWRNGSVRGGTRLILGHSTTWIDWRD